MVFGSHHCLSVPMLTMLNRNIGSYIPMTNGKLCIQLASFEKLANSNQISMEFINSLLAYARKPRYTGFGSGPPCIEPIQGTYFA